MQLQNCEADVSREGQTDESPDMTSAMRTKYNDQEVETPTNEPEVPFGYGMHNRTPSNNFESESSNLQNRLSGSEGQKSPNYNFVMNNNYTFIRSSHPSNDIYFFNTDKLAEQAGNSQERSQRPDPYYTGTPTHRSAKIP